MEDSRAKQYIKMYEREDAEDMNFKSNLWQPISDLILPRMNQILQKSSPGKNDQEEIFNTVGQLAAEDMASGLAGMIVPNGEVFYAVDVPNSNQLSDRSRRYLGFLTERSHEILFESNFVSQFNEALLSFCIFGPCNLFSEFDIEENTLNYLSFDIGTYTIVRDSRLRVSCVLVKWKIRAREAVKLFGNKAGNKVHEASSKPDTMDKTFEYLHIVEPRKSYNPKMSGLAMNMPYRSVWVAVEDIIISKEGGYQSNPYAIANWRKSHKDKWGRGRGCVALPACRQIQQMEVDLTECGNKYNNPPLEVSESFDGTVKTYPGAQNRVSEMSSIRALTDQVKGSYPVSREEIDRKAEEIKDIFLGKVFRQFLDLEGDRRTTVEIRERKNQALRIVGAPIMNLYGDLLSPTLSRSILLMIRHGKIIFEGSPNPPDELGGKSFNFEFMGELALALRDQKARGFSELTAFLGGMSQQFPEQHVEDYISFNRSIPRMAKAFGAGVDDIATQEEVAQKAEIRAQKEQAMMEAQAAMGAAEAYKNTTKAPEDGSPAGQM